MLASQDLGDLPIYVIVNRHERGFLKSIKTGQAEQALHHSIAATISNDFRTLSAAIDQRVPVGDIKIMTRFEKDMSAMIDMLLNHIEQREQSCRGQSRNAGARSERNRKRMRPKTTGCGRLPN